ncbi:hypothetical protein EG329_008628 [Mollisiaceae sp. DMI_Dod_QoI]|nr:hypothetical protein EG329_008628 [Helotiales sp. DMI_Dod_QoI]
METASTQTTLEIDSFHEAKAQGMSNHSFTLNDLRERLRNPKEYVLSLQKLEEETWRNSAISMYTSLDQNHSRPNLYKKTYGNEEYISYPLIPSELQDVLPNRLSDAPFRSDPTNTSDEEITALCKSATDCTASAHLNAIRMCRNVILRTFLNLKSLQKSNFCAGSFSILVLDKERRNVAKLLPIENTDFIALVFELEYILRDSASLVLDPRGSKSPLDIDRRFVFLNTPMVKQYCQSLLQVDEESSQVFDLGIVNILRFLVLTLDLAVASYSGAHCSDFLNDNLSVEKAIPLLAPFLDCSDTLKKTSVTFKRCQLQCLDTFHAGRAAWVFCPPNCEPFLPLYISATIDSFSDVWGPLWKLKDQESPDNTDLELAGERFCHWIHNEEFEDDAQDTSNRGTKLPDAPFDGTEKLLIGASWTPNPACSPSISIYRRRLQEAGRLCIVGASKPYHYNNSNQYQLQVGYSGVNVSATRQYKRIPRQSLKEILIELWAMEPDIRDPRLLEDLHGVEISMCTYNAQRVSLSQILRSNCMRHLLRDFSWGDPEYRTEHFLTLEDTLRPKRLQDPQFGKEFDYAIMLGLKKLSKTGVDRQDNLRVFLSSKCTPKPELATMVSKEHSWIGLLKDTTIECAMVAFGDECLGFNSHMGVSCGKAGCSVLRSAMVIHSSIYTTVRQTKLPEDSVTAGQAEKQGWDISKLPLGPQNG